ncbi:MAG: conjugal transfer protein TraN [Acinetobacter sp.]|uniref:conjugal transfer protein TraN n=1 Tax=Acinetobacter sp. TaxID=472 RepID=UPI0026268C7B|nr:conjugal transfer protein TraN [Acinetobacter sp.]MDD2944371.1 conjugal transfer protein TraN [Acinetobacter sp.]
MKHTKTYKVALGLMSIGLSGFLYTTPAQAATDYNAQICTETMTLAECQAAINAKCALPDGNNYPACKLPKPDYNARICTDGMTANQCEAALTTTCSRQDALLFNECRGNLAGADEPAPQPSAPAGQVPNKSNAKIGGGDAATLMFSPSTFALQQSIGFLQSFFTCKSEMSEGEKSLAYRRGANLCVYVGQYCSKKIKIGFIKLCKTKKKTYCCFNSKLARIINVEGRKQIGNVGWGSAENPRCEGFTLEEFNKIDISKMDLSEFVDEITQNAKLNVAKSSSYWEERNTNRTNATWVNAEQLGDDVGTKILSSDNPYDVFNQPTDGKSRNESTARTVKDETQTNTPKAVQTGVKQPVNQSQVDQGKQAIIDYYGN